MPIQPPNIPNSTFWTAIGTATAAVIAWLVRLERRQTSFLTVRKHESICAERNKDLKEALNRIEDKLEKQDEVLAAQAKSSNRTSISIAVIKTHMGIPLDPHDLEG